MTSPFFTVAERERIRTRLLEIAGADSRVVAGATIGSLAGGAGDRWSDLDLTFGLAPGTSPLDLLNEWTPRLEREFGAIHLFDLPFRSTLYRVFLFPGNLQVDLSFTPAAEFGAYGPKFKLLFGETGVVAPIPGPPPPQHFFGLGVHHVVRARFCIERGRLWQADYWIKSASDEAFALACLRHGLEHRYARGYDDLPQEIRDRFEGARARSLEREELLRALRAAIELLLHQADGAREPADQLQEPLRALGAADSPVDSPA